MIKKSIILFTLTSSLTASVVHASDRIEPYGTQSIILGNPSNPVVKLDIRNDKGIFKIYMAGKEKIYDSGVKEGNFDIVKFISNFNLNDQEDFIGLYDSKGSRGFKIGGKYYPSIFAVLNDITISGFPNNDDWSRFIHSLGKKVEDSDIAIQQKLQNLVDNAKEDAKSIGDLQAEVNKLAKQITEQSKFSSIPSALAPDTASTDVISFAAGDAITDLIESRMDTSDAALGKASGDIMQSFGVWVRGMFASAKQKEMKLVPEYKLNQQGITIGADVGEDDLIGVAFTTLASKIKQNNMHEKSTNYVGSIYGLYNFTDNVFINGQLKYGRSNIKKERKTNGINGIAHGKTKGEMLGGKVELGYYYGFMDKSQLIPSIGLSYDTITIKKYKETSPNNLITTRAVGKRTCDKTSLIGALVVNHVINLDSVILTPEVHTNINYTLKRKDGKTSITLLEGTDPVYIPSGKLPKTSYKVGGSLTASKSKNLEFVIGYDLGWSKKFRSHSGYIQARVDF